VNNSNLETFEPVIAIQLQYGVIHPSRCDKQNLPGTINYIVQSYGWVEKHFSKAKFFICGNGFDDCAECSESESVHNFLQLRKPKLEISSSHNSTLNFANTQNCIFNGVKLAIQDGCISSSALVIILCDDVRSKRVEKNVHWLKLFYFLRGIKLTVHVRSFYRLDDAPRSNENLQNSEFWKKDLPRLPWRLVQVFF
jgi:hypothetical protein